MNSAKMTTRSMSNVSNNANANANANAIPKINTCQVNGCRNKTHHVTARHSCGNGGSCMNGHGKVECGNNELISNLEKYKDDVISEPCTIEGCIDPMTHMNSGHSCLFCDERIRNAEYSIKHLKYCPLNKCTKSKDKRNKVFNEKEIKELDEYFTKEIINIVVLPGKYTYTYSGMGSTWFVRCDLNGNKQYLIMLVDDWGQYGKEISRVPELKYFIYGFEKMV